MPLATPKGTRLLCMACGAAGVWPSVGCLGLNMCLRTIQTCVWGFVTTRQSIVSHIHLQNCCDAGAAGSVCFPPVLARGLHIRPYAYVELQNDARMISDGDPKSVQPIRACANSGRSLQHACCRLLLVFSTPLQRSSCCRRCCSLSKVGLGDGYW